MPSTFGVRLELIHRAINGEIEIAISEAILVETMRVLRDKFEWDPYELRALYDSLIKICKVAEPKHTLVAVADDPDNRILECSEEAGSEFIITEDRALLRVKEHAGAKLVRAADFLAGRQR